MSQSLSMMDRRHFLRGLGSLIGLPFLPSLLPRGAKAASASAPRLVSYFVPCGYNMATFVPVNAGPNYTLSECLMPLAAYKAKMQVMTNLNNEDSQHPSNTRNGDHAIGTSAYGTYVRLPDNGGTPPTNGKSADQFAADTLAVAANRSKSLQIGVQTSKAMADGFGGAFPPLFTGTNSWKTATSPNPYLDQPAAIFNAIFGDSAATGTNTGPSAGDRSRAASRKSVLDVVIDQANTLSGRLGKDDANKLDQYLTNIRTVEQQVANLSVSTTCVKPSKDVTLNTIDDYFRVNTSLAVLALQCDATRVVNFMAGPGQSQNVFSHLGINDIHHNISHHGGDTNKLNQLTKIVTYEMTQVAAMLDGLNAIPSSSGNGTLLDDTIFVQSSEMGDPNQHDHLHTPALIIGGGNVGVNHGKGNCINYPNKSVYMASMWLTVLDKLKANVPSMGNMADKPITARLNDW